MRKEKIRLDYNNMLSQRIGDKGITPEELAAFDGELAAAAQRMAEKKANMGFRSLPTRAPEVTADILATAKNIQAEFDTFVVLGIGGMVVCSISAIQTGRLRTMIAYSSGAQIGYIYMGLGMGTQAALLAALLQIVAHAVTKPMLFLSGAGLAGASGGHQDFRSLRGAAHRAPAAGVLFTIGALSMVGIPIFAGFIPKLYFATAAAATVGWRVWAVWLALGASTVLNVLYFLYTAMLIWVPEETEHAQRPKRFYPLPTAGLAAMNLAVGLGSAAVTELFTMGMGLFCG